MARAAAIRDVGQTPHEERYPTDSSKSKDAIYLLCASRGTPRSETEQEGELPEVLMSTTTAAANSVTASAELTARVLSEQLEKLLSNLQTEVSKCSSLSVQHFETIYSPAVTHTSGAVLDCVEVAKVYATKVQELLKELRAAQVLNSKIKEIRAAVLQLEQAAAPLLGGPLPPAPGAGAVVETPAPPSPPRQVFHAMF
ncbi:hypothetical protein PAPYR_9637 [Paratrimastix pyriformis]|uniref:BLOC-1-related complex subunit 6 C-terminal helix domain-containing protein n=1 Tax=Paratrimastix pyriformis TaxID=342808 RepID=A0ABQ8UC01_9EUKA|nr:hypothetical protein PAPYR_9637 [Paratrimastix pyriformis]